MKCSSAVENTGSSKSHTRRYCAVLWGLTVALSATAVWGQCTSGPSLNTPLPFLSCAKLRLSSTQLKFTGKFAMPTSQLDLLHIAPNAHGARVRVTDAANQVILDETFLRRLFDGTAGWAYGPFQWSYGGPGAPSVGFKKGSSISQFKVRVRKPGNYFPVTPQPPYTVTVFADTDGTSAAADCATFISVQCAVQTGAGYVCSN